MNRRKPRTFGTSSPARGRKPPRRHAIVSGRTRHRLEIYYPVPLHQQACFAHLGYKTGSLPHTERAAEEMLNLPIYPELAVDEQETVVRAISRFYAEQRSAAA
ncbi:MAG: DegT/DnrJ/EryC1/StrS family aminotransferase [Pirellulaceae bacterium]